MDGVEIRGGVGAVEEEGGGSGMYKEAGGVIGRLQWGHSGWSAWSAWSTGSGPLGRGPGLLALSASGRHPPRTTRARLHTWSTECSKASSLTPAD